jgi:hypothetical protein
MSPEQAAGKTREIGPCCDVYGLGAVLYELLTGRPPFQAETPLDTVLQVMENDPVPPRLLNPNVDPDLETITLKCLEKEPRRRYGSAHELAEDLQRYLNGEPILARSFNILDRIIRTASRSQHDIAFHTWSSMVLVIAGIVLAEHVTVFALTKAGQTRDLVLGAPVHMLIVLARAVQFLLIGLVFWHNRGRRLLPTTSAERELWTIWIGYIASYGTGLLVIKGLIHSGLIERGPEAPRMWEDLIVYPIAALLSGLSFFVMGSNYWGRCYALGVLFWLLALFMPRHLDWAPVAFGLLWGGILTMLGLHLRRLGKQAVSERGPPSSDSPTVPQLR